MIGIIDCNIGNLGSISNILSLLSVEHIIVTQPSQFDLCDKYIFPGVGAFDSVASNIAKSGLFDQLENHVVHKGKYILGICVGLQIFCRQSEEGICTGFGWFEADVKKFQPQQGFKVPHMGWNKISHSGEIAIFEGVMSDLSRFYFLHSYYVDSATPEQHALSSYHVPFASSVQKNNIIGVQFHPEKSHKYGIQLLSNFVGLKS